MGDYATSQSGLEIAIIGMAGRFPGAQDIEAFWQNLRNGAESIAFFTDQEMEAAGASADILKNPNYVKAQPMFEGIEYFDADFFGFSPRQAETTDPQHRLFLECGWEALENAGYDAERYRGLIGVYAGVGANTYLTNNILPGADSQWLDDYQLFIGNDKDFLPTRVSYKLNLRGPSVNVQTACSTALVALHLACRSLLGGECDMALVGGVTVMGHKGYLYQEGGLQSPDGHCRAFDAKAQGTIFGSGVGAVVLKRLVDALNDGDYVHAVVKGSAINNDGALKIGYTAPSVEGQSQVIRMAHMISGVDAETISYVETHGTGTILGDPIEIKALTRAFRASTEKRGFCAIGSVKTNVGHLDTAAGAAGLIKTVMALKHKEIPPSLHFEEPNPQIDFENSPFYVNTALAEWKTNRVSRRAGVSSFGIGGTNAHVILEESPEVEPSGPSRPWQLLMLSAKTDTALEAHTLNLAKHLREHPDLNLADVAYTLQVGRKTFDHCRVAVCDGWDGAVTALETKESERVLTYTEPREVSARPVAFMFTGQGAQYVNMAAGLYQHEAVFREQVDRSLKLLRPHMELDLGEVLYPEEGEVDRKTQILQQTEVTQSALFVIEYALARLWMSWGIEPQAMIGHSIGEYVAACLAGVFTEEEALALVVARGRLMQQLPAGAMLAVLLPEEDVLPRLGEAVSLAAVNGPALCTVSGPIEAVEEMAQRLAGEEIEFRRLRTSHAFHSEMMEPILEPFVREVEKVNLRPPEIPYISNVSGTWITAAETTAPDYWARHLRRAVRFADGIGELLRERERVLLEVGPGKTLVNMARQHPGAVKERVIASLRHPKEEQPDEAFLLSSLGQLWFAGVQVDWQGFYAHERRLRVPLPTYPFERQRYWVEPGAVNELVERGQRGLSKRSEIGEWFYTPVWKQSVKLESGGVARQPLRWLVFCDECGLGERIAERLELEGQEVARVKEGPGFRKMRGEYEIAPGEKDDYERLFVDLARLGQLPQRVVHLWSVTPVEPEGRGLEDLENIQDRGFYSLIFLAQSLGEQMILGSVDIVAISNGLQSVTGEEAIKPKKGTLLGPCRVIPLEYDNITCRSVDVEVDENGGWQEGLVEQLVEELWTPAREETVAYRGRRRWVETYEPVWMGEENGSGSRLREGGVYLITGGLGGIGMILAKHLVQTRRAKLALISRSGLPEREEWEKWMEDAPGVFGEKGQQSVGGEEMRLDDDQIGQWQDELEENLGIKGLWSYEGLEEKLNSLCSSYAYEYLVSGGVDTGEGREYGREAIKEQLGVQPEFERFYDFMLKALEEEGVIGIEGERIKFLRSGEVQDAFELNERIEEEYPGFEGLLELLAHCAENYRAALSGEIEAIGVLYPDGSDRLLRESYEKTVEHDNTRINMMVVGRIIEQAAEKVKGRRLRILEVGGGGGNLTRQLMPDLINLEIEYHFTDIGKTFVVSAEQEARAQEADFMRFGVLDISRDPLEQGYEAGSFDVVLGYNVVHATRSIRKSVGNLKKLLAPGGVMCLVEQVKLRRWTDMVWGLAKGWWYYEDEDLREGSPLLSLEKWEEALGAIGFEEVKAYPQRGEKRKRAESGLIVARLRADAGGAVDEEKLRIQRRIEKVQELEALGGKVLVIGADVTDQEQMKEAVSQVYDRFGAIHGVIHAAGIPGGGIIQLKTREMAAEVLAPKVKGALVLKEVLGNTDVDYVFFSSQSSIVPRAGQVDYCAANAFLDVFARYMASVCGSYALSIDWGAWQSTGMQVAIERKHRELTGESLPERMQPVEGLEAFDRVLCHRVNQILVSPQDFEALMEENRSSGVPETTTEVAPPPPSGSRYSRPDLDTAYVAPRNSVEQVIAEIWQEMLGIEQVGIHDNFFELGGDSLLAMQVVARARQRGVEFRPQQLLEHATVAELAAVEGQAVAQDEQGLVIGPLPLTIAQRWFFETDFIEPNRWNANAMFEVQQRLDPVLVGQVVQRLLVHHDALRSRFVCDESGWRGFIAEPDEVVPVICVDLSGLSDAECAAEMWQIGDDIQGSLDLSEGPLLRVGLYDRGANRSGYLVIIVHHIMVDAHSTTILMEDFQKAYQQLAHGEQIQLSPKTTPLNRWLERLVAYAQSTEMRQELNYWLGLPWSQIHPLPVDYPEGTVDNTFASVSTVEVRLSEAETDVLLRWVPGMYDTQILDALLMAMVQAVAKWTREEWVPIRLLDSGRGIPAMGDADLSRTIGWLDFTGFILLKRAETDNPGDALQSIRDQFHSIPNRGLGFDLLSRLSGDDEISATLDEYGIDDLSFNYMGNIGGQVSEDGAGLMQQVHEDVGNWQNPQNKRSGHLFCPAFIAEGQLIVRWEYSENIHKRTTIETVANDFMDALRALIVQVELENAARSVSRPHAEYPVVGPVPDPDGQGLVTGPVPLMPAQHHFFGKDFLNPNRYVVSSLFETAHLEPWLLELAVHALLLHHDALRTRFVREKSGWRQFIVEPDRKTPFSFFDLSEVPEARLKEVIEFVSETSQAAINLSAGPLIQVALFDLGADRTGRLLVHVHHLVTDAPSQKVLLEDLGMVCLQLGQGAQVELPSKTTSVKEWAERLNAYARSEEMRSELDYWLSRPWKQLVPLPVDYPENRGRDTVGTRAGLPARLSIQETQALQQLLRVYGFQMLDALLMALVDTLTQWSGGDKHLFNVMDSGRSAIPLPQVDLSRTVGYLTLPRMVVLERGNGSPLETLRSIKDQIDQMPNLGLGYALLRECGGTDVAEKLGPRRTPEILFNYLGHTGQGEEGKTDGWFAESAQERTGWDQDLDERAFNLLECMAEIKEGRLSTWWRYSKVLYERTTVERLAGGFVNALRALIAHASLEDSISTDQQRLERPATAYPAVHEGEDITQDKRELVTGPVPLMPTQAWFLNEGGWTNPNRFVISTMFEVARLDPGLLERAVRALPLHHDALRARFVREESGWRQFIVEPDEETPFAFLDFSDIPADRHREEIEYAADALQNVLDLSEGPLIQVALFDLGIDQTGRLLLHVHHLASDGYSQRILLKDLKTACLQLSRGDRVQLPPKTTSFKEWSERLNAYARSDELRKEWDYWRTSPWAQIPPLPADYPEGVDRATMGSFDYLFAELSAEETDALQRLLAVHGFQMLEALLMALMDTLAKWSGQRKRVLNILDSGRSAIPAAQDVDLSRTVGFLALSRILVLEHEARHPLDALQAIRDQIRRVPSRGFGLTLLYFCGGDEIVGRLGPQESHCKPELLLNYLGQVGEGMDGASDKWVIGKAPEKLVPERDPDDKLETLGMRCTVEIKERRLVVQWRYSNVIHKRATAKRVIDGFVGALRALIACAESESATQSVSQPYLEYSRTELPIVRGHVPSLDMQGLVTGSVPLLPTQAWFLTEGFDNLDRFVLQNMFEVVRLDPGLLEKAVRILLLHHDMLRARFVREESGWRQFIVEPDEQTPFALLDFSEVPVDRHTEVIEFAGEALQHALNLSKGPMIQVAFFDLGVNRTGRLLMHIQHLVSDGYTQSILIEDLRTICAQLAQGDRVRLLPKTTSFKRWAERLNAYIWSEELREERDYWLTRPWTQVAPLPADYPENRDRGTIGSIAYFYFALSVEETVTLQQLLRERGFQMLDALLMALVDTLAQWSGEHRHLINVMDAGRSVIPGAYDIDLSRTVGYLALSRMMILERGGESPWDALRAIRDQIHQVPSGGFGYTLLYHCGGAEIAAKLEPRCRHDIQFNYAGHIGQESDRLVDEWVLGRAKENTGWYQDPDEKISDLLGCSAQIEDRLVVRWACSKIIHKHTTIERLANGFLDALRALITYSEGQEA
jgi:non-ribosomal peptide synthase protein (TIGR01720 family)